VAGQFLQRLPSIFDRAEADRPIASLLGRMHLTERENGLAVALLIESDEHSECAGVVFLI